MAKPEKDWSLVQVRAREARNALAAKNGADLWRDINVAHLDTGIRPHAVFGAWVDLAAGVNFMEAGQPPIDPLNSATFGGHGTRTLSVLTGAVPGQFQGVAPQLPVVPYRVADDVLLGTKQEQSNIARAIYHAVDERSCEVITISMGYPLIATFWHNALGAAVDYAYQRGVILVAAGGQVIDKPCYPGKFFRAIGVGGYRKASEDAQLSIYQDYFQKSGGGGGKNGDKQPVVTSLRSFIDVWASADPVWRLGVAAAASGPSFEFGFGDGTSYATPHVAGAAAMWLAYHHMDLVAAYPEPWQRVEAFRLLLKRSAQDLGSLPNFKGMKPATGTKTRPKGDTTTLGETGGLDILALLQAPLPPVKDLVWEKRAAENQTL